MGQPPQGRARHSPAETARRDTSLLAGSPSGPLHGVNARVRGVLRGRAEKVTGGRRAAPAIQDPLCVALLRRAADVRGGRERALRGTYGLAVRLQVAVWR